MKALTMVAEQHGYSLLWVVKGLDAFFIRNDLIDDHSDQLCFPFEKWRACTNIATHGPLHDPSRLHLFLDYEVYTKTSGDIHKSKKAAFPICKQYLVDGHGFLDSFKKKAKGLLTRLT